MFLLCNCLCLVHDFGVFAVFHVFGEFYVFVVLGEFCVFSVFSLCLHVEFCVVAVFFVLESCLAS